jgi:hypothetical protein
MDPGNNPYLVSEKRKMAIAQVVDIAPDTATGAPVVLPPNMVAMCTRGAMLSARLTADKKEYDAIKDELGAHLDAAGTREGTNAAGKVVAVRTHSENVSLDQGMLAKEFPTEKALCTHAQPWDSVSCKA